MLRIHNAALLALLVLPVVSGCALSHASSVGTAPLNASGQLHLPGKAPGHSTAIAYRAPGTYDEYHRRLQHGAVTEALYLEANGIQTALDFSSFHLHSLTQSQWRFNHAPAQLTWRKSHLAPTAHGNGHAKLTYARFRRQAQGSGTTRHCVAFVRTWDIPFEQPEQLPSRAYFGYHCAAPGQSLSGKAARTYVKQITTAKHKLQPVRYGDQVPNKPGALARARGTSGNTPYGEPGFPLLPDVHYVISHSK